MLPHLAVAQQPAPTFTLSGAGDSPGSTGSAQVNVNWGSPACCTPPSGAPSGTWHMEYCYTQDGTLGGDNMLVACVPGTQGAWGHSLSYNLGSAAGGTTSTVYGEYRPVVVPTSGNPAAYPSFPSSATVFLYAAIAPNANLNSPVGLRNSNFAGGIQPQQLNWTVGQWVSWWIWLPGVTSVDLEVCASGETCDTLDSYTEPQLTLDWAPPHEDFASGGFFYLAGSPPSTFLQFAPGASSTSSPLVTCNPPPPGQPSTTPCAILASGTGAATGINTGDMPMDPPSSPPSSNGPTFSGYADPSMRADRLLAFGTNPTGDNLYMSYSWAKINSTASGTLTPSLEIHLAASNSISAGYPSGWQWTAFCDPNSPNARTQCPNVTPIFGSPVYSSTSGNTASPFTGQVEVLSATTGLYQEAFTSGTGPYYSSHEVSNLAQWVDGSTGYWYSAHLVYFVPGNGSGTVQESLVNGCLVISMATGSPANLAWPDYTDQNPSTCAPTDPGWGSTSPSTSNSQNWLSYPLLFGNTNCPTPANGGVCPPTTGAPNLNVLSGQSCTTWGEPAIMVAGAPSGGGQALYLAAECFTRVNTTSNTLTGTTGYFVFYAPINSAGYIPSSGWTAYAPSGSIMTFNSSMMPTGSVPNGAFITEFDWGVRADGSMVAVVTPETVTAGGQPVQSGCIGIGFDLSNPSAPFSSSVAAVISDVDTSDAGGAYSEPSPNACTYDAQSNTGAVIVRHLTAPGGPNNSSTYNQIYSLISSGVNW